MNKNTGPEVADRWAYRDGPPPEAWLLRKGEVLRTYSPRGRRGPKHMSIRSKSGELRAIVDRDGQRVEPADIRRERMVLNDRETKRLESRVSSSPWKQPKHYWRDREERQHG